MPIDYRDYPSNWLTEIRPRILARAGGCCENCGLPDGAFAERYADGSYHVVDAMHAETISLEGGKVIRVVLTVAHLDHDRTHNADDNLRAWCAPCHLRYDAEHHARNAAATRRRKRIDQGQGVLL